jgi:small subunit ribosomal protein S2
VIPGNDDAIRACSLIARVIADGIAEGRGSRPQPEEEQEAAAADATPDEVEAIDEAVAEAMAVAGIGGAETEPTTTEEA